MLCASYGCLNRGYATKARDVPQDDSILQGNRRACYVEDDQGHYVIVPSRGWEVERIVNQNAVGRVRDYIEAMRRAVSVGTSSPLAYHMACRQMDVALLAANCGIWRWRIRRHMRPAAFARLPSSLLARYADALHVSCEELKRVPQMPPHE